MTSLLSRWRGSEPSLGRQQSLKGIPVRHETLEVEKNEESDKAMVIVNRIKRGTRWWSRFAPPVIEQRVELDEMGAFVFQRIDGERNVAQIIEEFVRFYRVNRREAELSTVAFLRKLAQKRLVSIIIR